MIPVHFPDNIGECIGYFELAVGLGNSLGANVGYIIFLIFGSEFSIFIVLFFFYLFFTYPTLQIFPEDDPTKILSKVTLDYREFYSNIRFLTTNLAILMTINCQLFIYTGLIYGIKEINGGA